MTNIKNSNSNENKIKRSKKVDLNK